MTNPNPSPELLQRARQIVADAKYDDPMFHALVMDGSMDFEMVDFVLAGMAEPQTLPAPGEVETLRKALGWYEQMVGDCRKITSVGDAARVCLDKDGGKLATQALATVAAANDEGVTGEALFRAFMVGDVQRLTTTALPSEWSGMQPSYRKAWDDFAIRLLSQGGGEA